VGEQGIAGKQGGRLVEGLVCGRSSATQVVIVHAGQIVVDQRISMDAFQRDARRQGVVAIAEKVGGGEREYGPQAFSAGFQAVAHGLVQACGTGVRRGNVHL